MPLEFGRAADLNDHLRLLIRRCEDLVMLSRKCQQDSILVVKNYFGLAQSIEVIDELLKKNREKSEAIFTNLDFLFQIDNYIQTQSVKVLELMRGVYRTMKLHLQEFEKYRDRKIGLDQLDYSLYEELIDFLSYHYQQKRTSERPIMAQL